MTQKPNTRAFLFDDISDYSSKTAFKRKIVGQLRLEPTAVLKRICGSDSINV